MKSCCNKGKLLQKSNNDTKIEDVLPFPTFPFMTFSVNHDTCYVKILDNITKHQQKRMSVGPQEPSA